MSPGVVPQREGRLGRPANPPGRPEISYRVGTVDSFTQEMLDRLVLALRNEAAAVAAPEVDIRPVRLTVSGPDQWLVALVKAWAAAADVLSFYQERIVQEGYLRTAREDLSVHELAQMVDYRTRPGVAGSADLAITLSTVAGLPEELELPPGLVVRSVPPPGSEPQTFETLEPLRARAAWNVLRPVPAPMALPPRVTGAATSVLIEGAVSGLAVGSAVLILANRDDVPKRCFRILTGVKALPGVPAATEISWTEPLDGAYPDTELSGVMVYALRQQTGLFGNAAPRWQELPPEVRQQVEPLRGGVRVYADGLWQPRNQGLPATATILCLAFDPDGILFAGTAADGVFRSLDGGLTWKPARRGLQQLDVQTVTVDPPGSLFAGTSAGGVYRSTDRGEIWETASAGIAATSKRPSWFPRWRPPKGPLPATTVRALAVGHWRGRSNLLAGTDSGVFLSTDAGRSWRPANRGLPGTEAATGATDLAVSSLAVVAGERLVVAGTARGVFLSKDGGGRWSSLNRGIPATDPFTGVSSTEVRTVAAYRDARRGSLRLFAGTVRGLFRSADGVTWQSVRQGVFAGGPGGDVEVQALTVLTDPATLLTRVFAATDRGLWTSSDHGETWTAADLDPPYPVVAVAASPEGPWMAAATPFAPFSPEWPRFRIQGGEIDLEGVVPGVVTGSWVALRPGDTADAATVGIYQVRKVSTVQRRDFGLAATVTRIEVEPDPRLRTFDLRQTRAFVASEPLALHKEIRTLLPTALDLLRAELVSLGDAPRRVIVTGKTLPVTLPAKVEPVSSKMLGGLLEQIVTDLDTIDPAAEVVLKVWVAKEVLPADLGTHPPAINQNLRAGELVEFLGQFRPSDLPGAAGVGNQQSRMSWVKNLFQVMLPEQRTMGQVAVAVEIVPRTQGTTLWATELAEFLATSTQSSAASTGSHVVTLFPGDLTRELVLDAASLQVYGNVVAASEGVTVHREVLGDGDANRANQWFQLAQPPTYLPESTIRLRVQDQLWQEVPVLHPEPGDSRVFRVQLDHLGRATVIFGNGTSGARLPSGRGNVVATYRTGMSTRQVPPGGLSLVASRPLGLEGVANPLPSTPGAAPESRESIRRAAPRQVRALSRVVSLQDYADVARDFPGVAKAGAWGLLVAGSPAVQITLAAPDGLDTTEGLRDALWKNLEKSRHHSAPLYIQDRLKTELRVQAKLQIAADFDPEPVRRAVAGAVDTEFGFVKSRFGGTISAAAVVSVIQRVPGVVAVTLRLLPDGKWGDSWERSASPPLWDPETSTLRAADLLTLSLDDLGKP